MNKEQKLERFNEIITKGKFYSPCEGRKFLVDEFDKGIFHDVVYFAEMGEGFKRYQQDHGLTDEQLYYERLYIGSSNQKEYNTEAFGYSNFATCVARLLDGSPDIFQVERVERLPWVFMAIL